MQTVATILLGALLVASALVSANQPQPESSQHIPPAEVYSPEEAAHHHQQQQQQQQQLQHHHQAVQQHPNSPNVVAVQQQPPTPQAQAVVSLQEQQVGAQPVVHMVEQPQQQQHQGPPPPASYHSAAAGMIQVVGEQQQQQAVAGPSGQKPAGAMVRNLVAPVEQYGQPESASIPANYKPFGSWGLYIGGNPADGYYTNYYKALGNSVEKQQQHQQQQVGPVAGVNQVSAFGPMLKQASSSPYVGADYYPFAYSQGELNSGYQMPMAVVQQGQQPGQQSAAGGAIISSSSPAGGAPQIYSASMVQPESGYVEHYASTKRAGGAPSGQQSKGYAGQKSYSSYPAAYPMAAPMASYPMAAPKQPLQQVQQAQQAQQQQQLYAYPVPVGSQIVGSQQGVDGAFMPYGVHAFTRYAVKPTMVSSPESGYYYSQPMSASAHQYQAAYKQMGGQQQQQAPPQQQVGYSPAGYYGHPMAQLHYSSSEGVFGQQQQQQQPGSQSYVGGQQVGVIDSPAISSVSGHFVHHPSVQYETSASENNAATVTANTNTNKATQKSKPDEQQRAKVVV